MYAPRLLLPHSVRISITQKDASRPHMHGPSQVVTTTRLARSSNLSPPNGVYSALQSLGEELESQWLFTQSQGEGEIGETDRGSEGPGERQR